LLPKRVLLGRRDDFYGKDWRRRPESNRRITALQAMLRDDAPSD
jgi:hypothetical protein